MRFSRENIAEISVACHQPGLEIPQLMVAKAENRAFCAISQCYLLPVCFGSIIAQKAFFREQEKKSAVNFFEEMWRAV